MNAVGGVLASTPLHWAARHGHTHMVALLVSHGADLHLRDVEGLVLFLFLNHNLYINGKNVKEFTKDFADC